MLRRRLGRKIQAVLGLNLIRKESEISDECYSCGHQLRTVGIVRKEWIMARRATIPHGKLNSCRGKPLLFKHIRLHFHGRLLLYKDVKVIYSVILVLVHFNILVKIFCVCIFFYNNDSYNKH